MIMMGFEGFPLENNLIFHSKLDKCQSNQVPAWDSRHFPWKSNLNFLSKLDKCQSIQVPDTPSILEVSGGLCADPY